MKQKGENYSMFSKKYLFVLIVLHPENFNFTHYLNKEKHISKGIYIIPADLVLTQTVQSHQIANITTIYKHALPTEYFNL